VLASKLSTNAKFQNLRDLNSRTFQGFSSTFKHLICFQALSRALKFLFQIQAFSRISQARYEPCEVIRQYEVLIITLLTKVFMLLALRHGNVRLAEKEQGESMMFCSHPVFTVDSQIKCG